MQPADANPPPELPTTVGRATRILVVNLGRRGGIAEYGWLMTRALARHAEVAVVYSAFAENRDKWSSLDRPQLPIRTFEDRASLVLSFGALARFARIRRFAQAFRPDVIYYPGGHAWKPVLDFVLPRSAAVVLTVHDPSPHPGEDSISVRLLDWANRRRAHGYVLLNEAERSDFVARRGLEQSRLVVIPHGQFDDYPSVDPTSDRTVKGIHLPDLGRYVLFVGRIRAYKGIDTLLAAYQLLDPGEAGPLVIAGSGEFSAGERAALHAMRDRPIHVINAWLTDAEMSTLVATARFVVLPYRSATQSGVIPLASAQGIPSIASAAGGLVEQVIDGRTGFLFPPGDARALGRLLARAYAMPDAEYRRLSSQAREHAAEAWTWDGLAERLARFCAGFVG